MPIKVTKLPEAASIYIRRERNSISFISRRVGLKALFYIVWDVIS